MLAFLECVWGGAYNSAQGTLSTYMVPFLDAAMPRHLESSLGSLSLDRNSMALVRNAQRLSITKGKCTAEIADALGSFRAALHEEYAHQFQTFDKDSNALRWVHTLIFNVKSFLLVTYHGLGKKHLQSCFDKFDFRFNRRFWPNQLFPRLVSAVASSNILGYVDLTR